jgi:hypothetical protein
MNQRLISDQEVSDAVGLAVRFASTGAKVAFFASTMPGARSTLTTLSEAGVNTLTLGFDHGLLTHDEVTRQFISDPEVTAIVIAAPACYGISLPDSFANVVRFDLLRGHGENAGLREAKVLAGALA